MLFWNEIEKVIAVLKQQTSTIPFFYNGQLEARLVSVYKIPHQN